MAITPPTLTERTATTPDAEEIVELLSDEHTKDIIETLEDNEQTASEIILNTDASKCTVYRRLNELEDKGMVSVSHEIRSDGHHAKTYSLVPCSVNIDIGCSGVDADMKTHAQLAD